MSLFALPQKKSSTAATAGRVDPRSSEPPAAARTPLIARSFRGVTPPPGLGVDLTALPACEGAKRLDEERATSGSAVGPAPEFAVGDPDDPLEREADRLAHEVLRPGPVVTRVTPSKPTARRKPQRSGERDRGEGSGAQKLIGAALNAPGAPLDSRTRAFFEPRFSYDFSGVRIHSDEAAAKSASGIGASAYSVGPDIVFDRGRYDPDAKDGRRLLAHELAHVVQTGRSNDSGCASSAPVLVRRQVAGSNPSAASDKDERVHSIGTSFVIGWRGRIPSLNEILTVLVDDGLLDETATRASSYVRRGQGWSVVHPQFGEIASFTVSPRFIDGRRFTDVGGWSMMSGKRKPPSSNVGGSPANDKGGGADATAATGDKGAETAPPQPGGVAPAPKAAGPSPADATLADQDDTPDYDTVLKGNPKWRRMSREDREILKAYAKLTPEDVAERYDVGAVTSDVKLTVALKLSSSWPEEVGEAAKAAFTDPSFCIMLIVTIGIYVGLWLVPEPSGITKAAAGLLTAVMLAMFAWEDIYGLAKAWLDLEAACRAAHSTAELKAAGDTFSRKVGSVGFNILMFIAMWGLGKAFGPKVAKAGAASGVKSAETGLRTAEANVDTAKGKPGSSVAQPATSETARLIETAKSNAKGATATAVLDALADLLPDSAKKGLRGLRDQNPSSEAVLRRLEQMSRGRDVAKYLADLGEPAETRQAAQSDLNKANAELSQAKLKLARAKLIESRTIADPALRETVRRQQYAEIRALLGELGSLDSSELGQALRQRDLGKVIAELRRLLGSYGDPRVTQAQGAVGEAIMRTTLKAKYAGRAGVRFFENLAVARRVGAYRTIAEWRVAEEGRLRIEDPDLKPEALRRRLSRNANHYKEQGGALYRLLTEIDTLVAETDGKGKARPIELAEAKTGGSDTPAGAAGQLTTGVDALTALAGGDADVHIFEMQADSPSLGADRTSMFELSRIGEAQQTTMGPKGKGFGEQFELTTPELRDLAESLLKNLPPANPKTAPPTALPYDGRNKKTEQNN